MNTTATRREEKEVPFKQADISNMSALHRTCIEHQVKLILGDIGCISLKMDEKSVDLPGFARKVAELGLIDRLPEPKRAAYLRDLATLECP